MDMRNNGEKPMQVKTALSDAATKLFVVHAIAFVTARA